MVDTFRPDGRGVRHGKPGRKIGGGKRPGAQWSVRDTGAARSPANMVPQPAGKARVKPRHWGLLASFIAVVAVPVAALWFYLTAFAVDQYGSRAGFTVRSEEGSAATDLLGGLQQIAGGGTGGDSDILFEFITSHEMVRRLNEEIDLAAHYSQFHAIDPVFSLTDRATIEDVVDHWQRVVRVSFDQSGGLIELQVLAFDPATAQALTSGIVAVSQALINELNAQARADSMRFAEADLAAALARLRAAREALTAFRIRTQIVDPESDLQGRMGVLNTLQQQLAEALIEFDLLSETTSNPDDPRLRQINRRITVIRDRIAAERQTFARDETGPGVHRLPDPDGRVRGSRRRPRIRRGKLSRGPDRGRCHAHQRGTAKPVSGRVHPSHPARERRISTARHDPRAGAAVSEPWLGDPDDRLLFDP